MLEQRHHQFVVPRAMVEALLYLPQLVLELLYVVLGRPRLVVGLLVADLGRPPRMVLEELLEKLLRNCCCLGHLFQHQLARGGSAQVHLAPAQAWQRGWTFAPGL